MQSKKIRVEYLYHKINAQYQYVTHTFQLNLWRGGEDRLGALHHWERMISQSEKQGSGAHRLSRQIYVDKMKVGIIIIREAKTTYLMRI